MLEKRWCEIERLERGKAKWRILGNEGSRKRKSSAGDRREKRRKKENRAKSRDESKGRKKVENEKSRQ